MRLPKGRRRTLNERSQTRKEVHSFIVVSAIAELKSQWPRLQIIGLICRGLADGVEPTEFSHFISRLALKAYLHMQHLRNY